MALGETLRLAREAMDLSASEVAAGTNMKVQLIQELETEDFSRMVAPIYGRGFIKLYAEYVNLDPEPLIGEYMSVVQAEKNPAPSLKTTGKSRRVRAHVAKEAVDTHFSPEESSVVMGDEAGKEPDLFSSARRRLLGRRPAEESSEAGEPKPVGPSLRERMVSIWVILKERGVGLWAVVRPKLVLPKLRLDAPVKWVAAAIGALLVLFLVVLAIQLVGSSTAGRSDLIEIVVPDPFVE
jgi:transcriptional regulator with XRE-family HTH domain